MTIPSPPDPDDELLARIARAEDAAIKWFYETFLVPVRVRLSASGLDEHECEDLADEVLFEAVLKIGSFDRRQGRFITWLLTIAKRRAIDFQRARGWMGTESGYRPREVSLEALNERVFRHGASKGPMTDDERAVLRYATPPVEVEADTGEEEDATQASPIQRALTALDEWLRKLRDADRIVAEHFLYGTPWRDVAARLSQSGKPVLENAAKLRGHRLIERAKRELAHVFK